MKKLDELRKLIDDVENEHDKLLSQYELYGFKLAISHIMDLYNDESINEETITKVIRYLYEIKEDMERNLK